MKYRFIQLKDLPESPAGTIYECSGIESRWDGTADIKNHDFYKILGPSDGSGFRELHYYRVGKCIFDRTEWFRKEVDYGALTELKCPKCGSTKAHVHIKSWYVRDMDRDDYGPHSKVTLECPCGCVREI